MAVTIKENLCEETLHKVENRLKSRRVPLKLFSELLKASKALDFTKVRDPVLKSRYLESKNKIEPYFNTVIYQSVYANCDDS